MVIARDRQHMVAINNPDYLKYMMSLNANSARARTVKLTELMQLIPVAARVTSTDHRIFVHGVELSSARRLWLVCGITRRTARLSSPLNLALQFERVTLESSRRRAVDAPTPSGTNILWSVSSTLLATG